MRSVVVGSGFVVLWSSGFVGAVLAADAGPASGLLAWRYLLTAALLLAVAGRRLVHLGWRATSEQVALGLLAHVAFLGGVFGAAAAGVDAGTTALVTALQPMLVAAAAHWWWRDVVTGRQVLGLVVGLLAVGLTVGVTGVSAGAAVVLPLVSVLGLSGAALLERRWRPTADVGAALAVQVLTAAVVFTAWATATGTLGRVEPTAATGGALVWLVVLSGLGGYGCFLLSLRRLGASTTSTLLYLTPPVTTLWAWLMFADAPRPVQVGGLVLGAVAVVLATRRGPGRRPLTSPDGWPPGRPRPSSRSGR